jgi:hypothetical protein
MPQQLSCIGEISAPVHGRRPRDDTGEWADGGRRREVAGTSEISASRRSSRIPSRRASTEALIITGDTPYLPRSLVAELLQLWAVLVQPGRRALRRRQ